MLCVLFPCGAGGVWWAWLPRLRLCAFWDPRGCAECHQHHERNAAEWPQSVSEEVGGTGSGLKERNHRTTSLGPVLLLPAYGHWTRSSCGLTGGGTSRELLNLPGTRFPQVKRGAADMCWRVILNSKWGDALEIPANGQVIHGLSDLCLFSSLLSMAVNFIKPFVSWDLETGRKVGIRLACHFHTCKFGVFPTLQMENWVTGAGKNLLW